MNVFIGLIIPFIGTTLGAMCVFLVKNKLNDKVQKSLLDLHQELWWQLQCGHY